MLSVARTGLLVMRQLQGGVAVLEKPFPSMCVVWACWVALDKSLIQKH